MKTVTDLTINPEPCSPEDEKTNWNNIAYLVNNQLLGDGGPPPDPDPDVLGWIRFELTTPLDPVTRFGQAIVLNESGAPVAPQEIITVYDVENRYPEANIGKKGYANLFGDTPVYEIVVLDVGLLDIPSDPPPPPPNPGDPPNPPLPPEGDTLILTINDAGEIVYQLLSELVNVAGLGAIDVLITESIPAAIWTAATQRRTPTWTTQRRGNHIAGVDFFDDPENVVSFWHKSMRPITVSSGKGRFGLVIDQRLVWVDCEEVSING
jgi:hypothetical protein